MSISKVTWFFKLLTIFLLTDQRIQNVIFEIVDIGEWFSVTRITFVNLSLGLDELKDFELQLGVLEEAKRHSAFLARHAFLDFGLE